MLGDLFHDGGLLQHPHHVIGVAADGVRHLHFHERTYLVPSEDYLIMSGVPHKRQGIELAIKRSVVVETTGTAFALKGGAVKPFSIYIGYQGHLAAVRVRERGGREAVLDRPSDLLTREIWPQHAVGIREPAANLTAEACAARDELGKDFGYRGHKRGLLRDQRVMRNSAGMPHSSTIPKTLKSLTQNALTGILVVVSL